MLLPVLLSETLTVTVKSAGVWFMGTKVYVDVPPTNLTQPPSVPTFPSSSLA